MIGFRVTNEVKKFLQRFAEKEHRTLSGFINHAVLTYIKEHHGAEWGNKDTEA